MRKIHFRKIKIKVYSIWGMKKGESGTDWEEKGGREREKGGMVRIYRYKFCDKIYFLAVRKWEWKILKFHICRSGNNLFIEWKVRNYLFSGGSKVENI